MDERPKSEDREASYANYFEVGFNAFEFVIDFGQHFEAQPGPKGRTRIITSPVYARVLESLLARTLAEYDKKYGQEGKE